MADVLKIALDRRNKLHDDIKKLDEFIRMADALMRDEDGSGRQMPQPAHAVPAVPAVPPTPTPVSSVDTGSDESPMHAAARKLSDAEVRRAPEGDAGQGSDAPRPSIIRRGLGG